MPSYVDAGGSFFARTGGGPVRVVVPATGDTVTMRGEGRALCVNPAGTIAALTVLLPAVEPGERVEILFRQIVTTLTLETNVGGTIAGAPTTAAAGTLIVMRFVNKAIGWIVWRDFSPPPPPPLTVQSGVVDFEFLASAPPSIVQSGIVDLEFLNLARVAAISPLSLTVTGGAGSAGAPVGTMMATMAPVSPGFAGTWSLGGTDAAKFAVNSATGALTVGGTDIVNGNYSITVTATPTNISIAPLTATVAIAAASLTQITSNDAFIFAVPAFTSGVVPRKFGQILRMGDCPAGCSVAVTDNSGVAVPYQLDQIGPAWPDGSWRHCVVTAMVPAGGPGQSRLKINRVSGVYTPASTPRAVSDITTGHSFKVHYKGVLTHPNDNDHPTWSLVGGHAGNFTFDLNAAIAAGHYQVIANGPCRLSLMVYGQFTDDFDGTTVDPHLFCRYYITAYTDPSNSTFVLYFEHMAKISQPFANPTDTVNIDVMVGAASLVDGATILRDLGNEYVAFGPDNVTGPVSYGGVSVYFASTGATSNGPSASSKFFQVTEWYEVRVQPNCTLPAGMTDGMIVTPYCGHDDQAFFPPAPIGLYTGYNGAVQPIDHGLQNGAASGNNSFHLLRRQFVAYYAGFYITANDNGDPVLSPGTWATPVRFIPNLDGTTNDHSTASQKAYWQAAGAIPGWDLTIAQGCSSFDNAVWGNTSGTVSPWYRPGSNGPQRLGIGASGAAFSTDGPWCEWDARWIMRMGSTNWSQTDHAVGYVAALATAHLPTVEVAHRPIGTDPPYLLPWDNGSDNAGAPYPKLGTPFPFDGLFVRNADNTQSGFVIPPNLYNGSYWRGAYSQNADNYHWPIMPIFQYLIFGDRWFIDEIRNSANRTISVTASNSNFQHRTWGSDGNFKFYGMPTGILQPHNMQMTLVAAAGYLGAASDPEIAYFQNCVDQWFKFTDYAYGTGRAGTSYMSPGVRKTGWVSTISYQSFNSAYSMIAHAWVKGLTRHPLAHVVTDLYSTYLGLLFDNNPSTGLNKAGFATFWAGAYMIILGNYLFWPASPPGGDGQGSEPYPDVNEMAILRTRTNPTGIWGPLDVDGTIHLDSAYASVPYPIRNGDPFTVGPDNDGPFWGVGPAAFGPLNFPATTIFYVCQLDLVNRTLRASTTPDGLNPITSVPDGPWGDIQAKFRGQHDQPGNLAGNNGGPGSDPLLRRAALAELMRVGAVPTNPIVDLTNAYNELVTRVYIGTTFTGAPDSAASGAKLCQTIAVPVYPPFP